MDIPKDASGDYLQPPKSYGGRNAAYSGKKFAVTLQPLANTAEITQLEKEAMQRGKSGWKWIEKRFGRSGQGNNGSPSVKKPQAKPCKSPVHD